MNFNILNSEQLYFEIENKWNKTHDIEIMRHVDNILITNPSLWHTSYGNLYKSMCNYFGIMTLPLPLRNKSSKYIIVIYKRYE